MSKSELLSHRYCTMQSKFSRQHLLSSKKIFIAAPCLIGITAIAALLTSMSMERSDLSSATSNALPTPSQVPQSIPAKPITPQAPIAASPLSNSTPLLQASSPRKTSAPTSQSTPQRVTQSQSKTQVSQAQKSSPATKAQPTQTALSMQAFSSTVANDVPQVPIRVAIVHDAQSFTVATSEPGLITDSAGQILKNVPAQSAMGVFASSGGLQLGEIKASNSVWIRTKSPNGLVFVDGKWYRGFVQLIPDQGRLLAVNHVEMQPYLYSVVGSEMYHDWPLEALKAQAIAARSYALVHIIRPASSHFDLGSTQRWQAYKGVNSEAKPVLTAVNETNGIVISHNGGVVESLYASSAELVRDAHKGFGMSQYGARDLASQNLNYRQILSRFYPGTELSLLQIQQ